MEKGARSENRQVAGRAGGNWAGAGPGLRPGPNPEAAAGPEPGGAAGGAVGETTGFEGGRKAAAQQEAAFENADRAV